MDANNKRDEYIKLGIAIFFIIMGIVVYKVAFSLNYMSVPLLIIGSFCVFIGVIVTTFKLLAGRIKNQRKESIVKIGIAIMSLAICISVTIVGSTTRELLPSSPTTTTSTCSRCNGTGWSSPYIVNGEIQSSTEWFLTRTPCVSCDGTGRSK